MHYMYISVAPTTSPTPSPTVAPTGNTHTVYNALINGVYLLKYVALVSVLSAAADVHTVHILILYMCEDACLLVFITHSIQY